MCQNKENAYMTFIDVVATVGFMIKVYLSGKEREKLLFLVSKENITQEDIMETKWG